MAPDVPSAAWRRRLGELLGGVAADRRCRVVRDCVDTDLTPARTAWSATCSAPQRGRLGRWAAAVPVLTSEPTPWVPAECLALRRAEAIDVDPPAREAVREGAVLDAHGASLGVDLAAGDRARKAADGDV